jgi:hypothetical protein
MSALPSITISLSKNAEALLERMNDPQLVLQAVRRGMDEANLLIVSTIQRAYLSFPKGQPPTLAGLRTQSGDYRRSLRPSKATITGDSVTSAIGTNVTKKGFSYPRLHEFGGTVKRKPRGGIVRLKTKRDGTLVRQADGRLAVFARRTNKQFKEVAYQGKAYEATYPARAPIQRGIRACALNTSQIVSRNVINALSGKGGDA